MQKMQLSAINRWMQAINAAINREKVAINHMINRVQIDAVRWLSGDKLSPC